MLYLSKPITWYQPTWIFKPQQLPWKSCSSTSLLNRKINSPMPYEEANDNVWYSGPLKNEKKRFICCLVADVCCGENKPKRVHLQTLMGCCYGSCSSYLHTFFLFNQKQNRVIQLWFVCYGTLQQLRWRTLLILFLGRNWATVFLVSYKRNSWSKSTYATT